MTFPYIGGPEVSLVMPCYNEEACLDQTAHALLHAFFDHNIRLELVLVDNGSTDRTGAIIDAMIAEGLPVKKVHIPVNKGYGHGICEGLRACSAPFIGYLPADGQIGAEDTVRTYRVVQGSKGNLLGKVRRRFRQDSWRRKVISVAYNGLMWMLFGHLGAIDINASPKIFSREAFDRMRLVSSDWFLDPELIIKAHNLDIVVEELNVPGLPRLGGKSKVRIRTIFEFMRNILRYRFGSVIPEWKSTLPPDPIAAPIHVPQIAQSAGPDAADPFAGIRILESRRFEDARGFLQRILAASQCDGATPRGEVYVSAARPGEAKGNHMHRRMGEWFAIVQGNATIEVLHPESGQRRSIPFGVSCPRTIYIPPGLAHAIVNHSDDLAICVAWAEREHDPADVFAFHVWPA